AGAALVAEAWRRIPHPHRGSRWRSLSGGERRWVHAQPPAPGADRPADVVVAIRAPGAGLARVSQEPAAIAAAVSRRDRRTPRVRRIRYRVERRRERTPRTSGADVRRAPVDRKCGLV